MRRTHPQFFSAVYSHWRLPVPRCRRLCS